MQFKRKKICITKNEWKQNQKMHGIQMKNWKKCTLSEIWEKCTLFRYFFFIVYCTFGVTSAYDFWWHEHLWLVASRSIHRVITQQALVSDIRLSYARCPPSLAHTNLWSIGLIRSGDLEMIGWLSETTGQKLSGSWQRGRGTKQHIFFFFSDLPKQILSVGFYLEFDLDLVCGLILND